MRAERRRAEERVERGDGDGLSAETERVERAERVGDERDEVGERLVLLPPWSRHASYIFLTLVESKTISQQQGLISPRFHLQRSHTTSPTVPPVSARFRSTQQYASIRPKHDTLQHYRHG